VEIEMSESIEIVIKERDKAWRYCKDAEMRAYALAKEVKEAAAAIERLTAELAKARDALENITYFADIRCAHEAARAALPPKPEDPQP
jgi:4-hydroxyphenylpyruvate dioxygenase-like putative hemolysin